MKTGNLAFGWGSFLWVLAAGVVITYVLQPDALEPIRDLIHHFAAWAARGLQGKTFWIASPGWGLGA